jgi:hypothetical protein
VAADALYAPITDADALYAPTVTATAVTGVRRGGF